MKKVWEVLKKVLMWIIITIVVVVICGAIRWVINKIRHRS